MSTNKRYWMTIPLLIFILVVLILSVHTGYLSVQRIDGDGFLMSLFGLLTAYSLLFRRRIGLYVALVFILVNIAWVLHYLHGAINWNVVLASGSVFTEILNHVPSDGDFDAALLALSFWSVSLIYFLASNRIRTPR